MSDKIIMHRGSSLTGYMFKGDEHLSMSVFHGEHMTIQQWGKPVFTLPTGEFVANFVAPGGDNLTIHTADPCGLANVLEDMARHLRQAEFEAWCTEVEASA